MNLRTLKKHCARAMETLIREHNYPRSSFVRAEGAESVYAPPGMERRFVWKHWLKPGPLKGTWLLLEKTSYEYDEWDFSLPVYVLREIERWQNMSDEDLKTLMLAGNEVTLSFAHRYIYTF